MTTTASERVSASASGSDGSSSIEHDGAGAWFAVLVNSERNYGWIRPIDSDLYVARSVDDGATWETAKRLTPDSGFVRYPVFAPPDRHLSPVFGADPTGRLVAVWQSQHVVDTEYGVQPFPTVPVYTYSDYYIAVSYSADAGESAVGA